MERFFQVLLIGTFIAFSWLSFMIVHECGHIIAAAMSGGTISEVFLHPAGISWSRFVPNPHPQFVAWGGPVLGSILPLILLAPARILIPKILYLFKFFAGFCLIANGAYLLIDSFSRSGDGGELLKSGAQAWQLYLFAALTIPAGLWLWHGLGPYFGLGQGKGKVSHRAAIASAILLFLVVALELMFAPSV